MEYLKMATKGRGAVRRRRHHHEYHNLHHSHSSSKPLAEGLSNSREAVASNSIRPSSFVNNFFDWVNKGTEKAKGLVGGWLAGNTVDFNSEGEEKILKMGDKCISQVDTNGTILLLDTLVRRATGQKRISSEVRSISEQEANGYAINITEGFEKIIEEAAQSNKISISQSNIDFPKV